MRILYVAISAVSAAIAFSSCENLNEDYIGTSEEIVINASISEQPVDTKTAIDEFGSKVKFTWLAGDAISVFFGDSDGSKFVTDVTSPKAQFKGTIETIIGGGEDLTDETSLWGVYPYDSNTTCDGSLITMNLPYEQGAVPDTFADDLFPSIARSTNFTMAFYPVCGSIRFKVSNPDIVKVTLSGNNNEDLAGKATVSMLLGGVPEVEEISDGHKELVMYAPDSGCFDPDKYYYFVFYPSDFSKGYTLTYYKSDSKATYVKDTAYPVKRNQFGGATNKDSGLNFTKIEYPYIDENGFNHGSGIVINGIVWAPVNCGYHPTDYPYGKLYQWGRKYGQGYEGPLYDVVGGIGHVVGTVSDATIPLLEPNSIEVVSGQDMKFENTFFNVSISPFDWATEQFQKCWNINANNHMDLPIKTNYDPCPEGWRVPTYEELTALAQNHSSWTKNEKGLNGYYFSGGQSYAEDAPSIFLSAAGYRDKDGNAQSREFSGYYWSSSSTPYGNGYYYYYNFANQLNVGSSNVSIGSNYRVNGYSIRCVKDLHTNNDVVSVEEIILKEQSVTIPTGARYRLTFALMSDVHDEHDIVWTSLIPSVVVIDESGMLTAINEGWGLILVEFGNMSQLCRVIVKDMNYAIPTSKYIDEYNCDHGYGIAIGDVVWAPVNCGYHVTDYPYGKLYQWGRKYGQGYDTNDASYPNDSNIVEGPVTVEIGEAEVNKEIFYKSNDDWCIELNNALWHDSTGSKANSDPCPEGWRLPTPAELEGLSRNYSKPAANALGQDGYYFCGEYPYSENIPSVFLPAAGMRENRTAIAFGRGYLGDYWSGSVDENNNVYTLRFDTDQYAIYYAVDMWYSNPRGYGYSVRCVQE